MRLISNIRNSPAIQKLLKTIITIMVFLYIFLIPSFGESSSKLNVFVYMAMILLTMSVIVYCFLFDNFKLNRYTLLVPAFAILAFIGTAFYSHDFRRWFSLVLLAISFFTFLLAFKILDNKFLIIHIISAAFFCFSVLYIYHYRNDLIHFKSFVTGKFRLGSYFDNPNGVAAFEVVGFAAPLYLILFYNKKRRFLHIFPLGLSAVVGISTGSRSYILAIGIFILVLFFFVFKKHKWIYLITIAILTGIFIGLLQLPFLSTVKNRFIDAVQTLFGTATKIETSTLERVIWADYGFFLGLKNAITGYGANGFSIYSGVGTYAHNNFAEVICDFGIFGLVLFYSPLILLLVFALKKKKIDKSLVISFVLYYFLISFSNVLYYKKIYYMVLAFLYYLVFFSIGKHQVVLIKSLNNIVFTCDSMGSGGAEKVISTLANEMSRIGINVSIIGVGDPNKPHSFYKLNDGVNYLTLANEGGRRIKSLKRIILLRKTICSIGPDVVISFLPNANIYTCFSLIGTNIPYINSERNNPRVNPTNKLERVLKKLSFMMANGSVFQTNDALQFYPEIVKKKATIIKNPISFNKSFATKVVKRNKVVLAVGRLTKQKNYINLLEAFKIFNEEKNHEYMLRIYGEGPLKDELIDYCKSININNNVTFMGSDNNWHEKEIDDSMYVLSSDYEGMPNSLAEAMALGIPSISTDCPCGGSRELINDGVNGFLVPVNNPSALSEKMLQLSNQITNRFKEENSNMVIEYSPSNITNLWIQYMKNLTKEVYE